MTKKEIVKQISDNLGLTQLKTKDIVQKTFKAIIDTLISERRIELRNFGVFEVKKRKARKARNPRTGDPVQVPPKFVVTFKPGKLMEERVRQLEEEETLSPPRGEPASTLASATGANGQSASSASEDGRAFKVVHPDDTPAPKPRKPRKVP